MSKRNKKKIVIGILCCMLVFMGIGYAALSQVLNIGTTAKVTGSWKIYISSATVKEKSDADMNGTEITDNKTTDISLNVSFKKPSDYITYDITVENAGTIDAKLDEITMTPPSNVIDGTEEKMFLMETQNLTKGSVLKAGETATFQMTLRFNEKATALPSANEEFIFGLKLTYVQSDSANVDTSGTGGGTIGSDNSGLKVVNGVLTEIDMDKYQLDSNGYLVVPATNENGDQITTIGTEAFTNYNVTVNRYSYEENGTSKYLVIIHDKNNADDIKQTVIKAFGKDESEITFKIEEKTGVLQNEDFDYEFYYADVDKQELVQYGEIKAKKIDLSQMSYLKTIGVNAFEETGLEAIKFNNGLENINDYSFSYTELSELNFPSTLKTIGYGAFNNDQRQGKLTKLTIPSSVTSIGEDVFYSHNISTLIFEGANDNTASIKNIGTNAFGNNKISNLVIPKSLTTIGSSAFGGNPLTNVTVRKNESDCSGFSTGWAGNATVVYDPS